MAKLLSILEDDDERLNALKKKMKAKSKAEVFRKALRLLEGEIDRLERIKQWKKAVQMVDSESHKVLSDFQYPGRFKRLP